MAKFLIPQECHPGVQRHGKLYRTFEIADFTEEETRLKFVPLDAQAYEMLVKKCGAEKVKAKHGPGPVKAPSPADEKDEGLTLRQMDAQEKSAPHTSDLLVKQTSHRKK
jgi:hypothetical protein